MSSPSPDIAGLVLGGAQFGLDYGITNAFGRIGGNDAKRILAVAAELGIRQIDTAQGYGDSEAAIGAALCAEPQCRFGIITKLSPLTGLHPDALTAQVVAEVEASLAGSAEKLGRRNLDVVLLHRAAHFTAWGGIVWDRLLAWRNEGRIARIGVSVQNPAELDQALDIFDVSFVQLPCNLLDWRWQRQLERLRVARRDRGLQVHVRSALLQGLLTSDTAALWACAHVADSWPVTHWLRARAIEFADGNIARLCINYVRGLDWVDGVVVGVASLDQLKENAGFFAGPALCAAALQTIESGRPHLPASALDPAQWRQME
jgi:aryl-alcohol dehydrogenase-like predicted oxidoreductase